MIKEGAVQVLGNQVTSSEVAVEALVRSIRDPEIQHKAVNALFNLEQISESAIKDLDDMLHDNDKDTRLSALLILSNHVHPSEAAALAIVDALNDTEMVVKDTALNALRRNGVSASTVLVLLERLKGGDKAAKDAALSALSEMSETVLTETTLKHRDKEIRDPAALALKGQRRWSKNVRRVLLRKHVDDMAYYFDQQLDGPLGTRYTFMKIAIYVIFFWFLDLLCKNSWSVVSS
ncbi:hypothetical protein B0O80DRAFT_277486 [Mortierella sp. GBAus27b]|nr:hypothetical protein B0O80DRAFT_277486 [Mortierella sp. GBAus27b]